MSNIEAVVFDVGGVLHKSNSAFANELFRELDITPDDLKKMRENEIALLGSGEISEEDFWKRTQVAYGIRPVAVSENLLGRAFGEAIEPHAPILELVKELGKSGIKLAILSNTIEPHAKALRQAGIYNGFDFVLLSHELGMQKPDAAIYEHTLKVLGTKPEATIFIDDDPKNVEAAQALGIKGIVYTEAKEVIQKVRTLIF